MSKPILKSSLMPVEVIFNPNWWNKNCGITFDKDFFFNPKRRVEDEAKMRNYLYQRFGDIGLGEREYVLKPVIGAVHLAAGFIVSQLLGCEVAYHEDAPPDVITRNLTDKEVLNLKVPKLDSVSPAKELIGMMDALEDEHGYLQGDINWGGVQNIALDLRGQQLFIDYFENPQIVNHLFNVISETIVNLVTYIRKRTETSSISVNPQVRNFTPSINLHSNCSITMISQETYEEFLLKYDNYLSENLQPYGIHHCGDDMDRLAESYGKVSRVCFFDVGWGSDVAVCREKLPNAFLNLRLSPVKLLSCSKEEVEKDIKKLIKDNGGIKNAGLCCINIDYGTSDENIRKTYEVADELKQVQY